MAFKTLGTSLVVFNCGIALVRGGDDNMDTAWQETFENLYTNGAFMTPVIRASFTLNAVLGIAILCMISKYTPIVLELYSHWIPI
jgi:hypothetical protein